MLDETSTLKALVPMASNVKLSFLVTIFRIFIPAVSCENGPLYTFSSFKLNAVIFDQISLILYMIYVGILILSIVNPPSGLLYIIIYILSHNIDRK